MMEVVPDNEQQSGPPALRPPNEPAPIDPEQVRQFQQFQQFQQLMRQQGDVPLLAAAPKPLWKRILGAKLVRRLILLAIVLATIPLWLPLAVTGVAAVFSTSDDRPASETGGGTNETNIVHEKTPKRTVRQVYSHIAQYDQNPAEQTGFVCGQFEGGAEQRFATNVGAANCEQAVATLHGEIDKSQPGWRNSYAEPFTGAELGEEPLGESAEVDTCELSLQPRLGVFSLRRIASDQWVIIGHEAC